MVTQKIAMSPFGSNAGAGHEATRIAARQGEQGAQARAVLYWLSLTGPLLTLTGNLLGGPLVLAAGALVWLVLPALELLRLETRKGAPLQDRAAFDLLLAVHVIVQLANVAALGWLATRAVPGWVLAGAIFSTGTTTGTSAFIVAHELMHRPTVRERLGSWVLLMTCLNTHFHVEHVHVHHKKVGTDDDPASARASDNTFTFIVRATLGQLVHAWQVALRKYPEQRGGPRLPYLSALIRAVVVNVLMVAAFFAVSPVAGAAFLAQALVATFMLNVVNFVEHWGLRRTTDEPVSPAHSWDTRSVITRYTLFDLGMHADHHFRASKPYWRLEEHEEAPEMPVGLYAATVMSLCPPLFRAVFAPALARHRQQAA